MAISPLHGMYQLCDYIHNRRADYLTRKAGPSCSESFKFNEFRSLIGPFHRTSLWSHRTIDNINIIYIDVIVNIKLNIGTVGRFNTGVLE